MSEKGQPNGEEYRRGKVDKELEFIRKAVERILNILEENGNPGLISQVRRLSEWKDRIEKLFWVVIVAIILDIVVRVLNSQLISNIFNQAP